MKAPVNMLYDLVRAGGPEPDQYEELNHLFGQINTLERRGEFDDYGPDFKEDLMGRALSYDTMQGFAFRKPHGRSGDFELVERIYGGYMTQDTSLKKWDEFWSQQAIVDALQNAKHYFKQVMSESESEQSSLRVLNVASGSSRSVAEYLNETRSNASFSCMDHCWHALDYARLLCRNHTEQVSFRHGHVAQLSLHDRYDLIWSEGLFDYLNDQQFKVTLEKLLAQTDSGGQIVIGNLNTSNPSQNYMDFLTWHVNPRSNAHLRYLAECCGIARSRIHIVEDQGGVNLFLHIAT